MNKKEKDEATDRLVACLQQWDMELEKKYPLADSRHVYALLTEAKSNGRPISKILWREMWKKSHLLFKKKVDDDARKSGYTGMELRKYRQFMYGVMRGVYQ